MKVIPWVVYSLVVCSAWAAGGLEPTLRSWMAITCAYGAIVVAAEYAVVRDRE